MRCEYAGRARGRAAAYRRGMDWTSFEAEVEAALRGRGRYAHHHCAAVTAIAIEAVVDTACAP
jgi:hypothetical protein